MMSRHWLVQIWRSASGRIGLLLLVLLGAIALLIPLAAPYDPTAAANYSLRLQPPSPRYWLGTDGLGRDVLVQISYGLRTSLFISLVSVSLGMIAGVPIGLVAGYWGGWIDRLIGWFTDLLLAFPSILLAIAIVTITGPSLGGVVMAISLIQLPIIIRLTRSMVFAVRSQDFIQAVTAMGATPGWVIWRHLLPHSLPTVLVQATLAIGTATLEAAGLGFLGLGAQPPTPELGTMLADAFKGGYSLSSPWTMIFPGGLITLMVLAFNLLGDGLRDSLDPRSLTIKSPAP